MKVSLVVFDLDGTLISSHETIYKATIHALRQVGIYDELPVDRFNKMIGWHFEDIFNAFGFAVPDFEKFLTIYKSVYFDYIDASFLFDGVLETLNFLKKKNVKTALLTTKGQDQAEILANYFKMNLELDYIMGRRAGIAHKPSPEPLLKICSDLSIKPENTILVGDTEMDVECGKNSKARTCAVTYGYRSKEELEKLSPDFLIDNITQLEYIVDGL